MTDDIDKLKAFRLHERDVMTHAVPLHSRLRRIDLDKPFTMEKDGWMWIDSDGSTFARVRRVEYDDGEIIEP